MRIGGGKKGVGPETPRHQTNQDHHGAMEGIRTLKKGGRASKGQTREKGRSKRLDNIKGKGNT